MSSSKKGLANGYRTTLNKNSDVEIEILKLKRDWISRWVRRRLDILLFKNSVDIFSEIILVLLSLLLLRE